MSKSLFFFLFRVSRNLIIIRLLLSKKILPSSSRYFLINKRMSEIWTFSPSSQPLLQRCVEAALLQETENQWTQKFGRKNTSSIKKSVLPDAVNPSPNIETSPTPDAQQKNEVSVSHDDFFDRLEQEVRLDFVVKECNKNPEIFRKMAQNLPVNTVEKLFKLTFAAEDVENSFLNSLFLTFLPNYIKKNYTCSCIDILTKTNEKHPKIFQKLIQILVEDIEIPPEVLNNYISTLDDKKSTNFVESLSNLDISSEIFVHNILMIYSAYKNSIKTEKIQNWICANLLKHSKSCTTDRSYGRLFLAYLQAEKALENTVTKMLAECLEEHHSPFRRPCVVLIKELTEHL